MDSLVAASVTVKSEYLVIPVIK